MNVKAVWGCITRSRPQPVTKHDLDEMEKRIVMKISELSAKLDPVVLGLRGLNTSVSGLGTKIGEIGTQIGKAKEEILAALGDAEVPEEVTAKINALGALAEQAATAAGDANTVADTAKVTAQALDDLNPDKAT